jgi:hypothetical protein
LLIEIGIDVLNPVLGAGVAQEPLPKAIQAFALDHDGEVETPLDGAMPVEAFAKAITAPTASPKP